MNSQVASYYRAILFTDGQDTQLIPKSLLNLHTFAEKRHQALGLGSTITKATALAITLSWLSGTNEGRAFAADPKNTNLGDMFTVVDDSANADENDVDWFRVPPQTPVVVFDKGVTVSGEFINRRGVWLDVMVDGKVKHLRIQQVQLAGA